MFNTIRNLLFTPAPRQGAEFVNDVHAELKAGRPPLNLSYVEHPDTSCVVSGSFRGAQFAISFVPSRHIDFDGASWPAKVIVNVNGTVVEFKEDRGIEHTIRGTRSLYSEIVETLRVLKGIAHKQQSDVETLASETFEGLDLTELARRNDLKIVCSLDHASQLAIAQFEGLDLPAVARMQSGGSPEVYENHNGWPRGVGYSVAEALSDLTCNIRGGTVHVTNRFDEKWTFFVPEETRSR